MTQHGAINIKIKKLFSFKKPAVRLHKTVCESQLIFPLPLEMECFKQTGRVQFVYKMVNEYTTICLMHVFILLQYLVSAKSVLFNLKLHAGLCNM